MMCPFCRQDNDRVVDTRGSMDGQDIRRRRECMSCGRRFTSYERLEEIPILVSKRNGSKEPFDRAKVVKSVEIACRKRPVTKEDIEDLANRVQMRSVGEESREITSRSIGEYIMGELKKLDAVAYVRFSSVYRDYQDVDQFIELIRTLKMKGGGKRG